MRWRGWRPPRSAGSLSLLPRLPPAPTQFTAGQARLPHIPTGAAAPARQTDFSSYYPTRPYTVSRHRGAYPDVCGASVVRQRHGFTWCHTSRTFADYYARYKTVQCRRCGRLLCCYHSVSPSPVIDHLWLHPPSYKLIDGHRRAYYRLPPTVYTTHAVLCAAPRFAPRALHLFLALRTLARRGVLSVSHEGLGL